MSNRVAIVTDSTAYLPEHCLQQYNISVTPLSVIWEDQVYMDGVDILPADFYTRLAASKVIPTTSQVMPAVLKLTFESLLLRSYDVLGIFLSSRLSSTVQSAIQARRMLPRYAAENIAIVDSLWTTMAMGWPVLSAARAAETGASLAECQKVAEDACVNSGVLFVVGTLEFLRRGGRIGGAQALLGTLLNIKPVLEMRDGTIEAVERVRTKQKAVQRMLEIVAERIQGKTNIRLAVTHSNAEPEAASLLETARAILKPIETMSCPLSPVIGTHVGPGTIALNYMSRIA
jgi:DegV family protein with EDD domain